MTPTRGTFYIAFDANGEALGVVMARHPYAARFEAGQRWGRETVIEWDKASDRLKADAFALTSCLPREYAAVPEWEDAG